MRFNVRWKRLRQEWQVPHGRLRQSRYSIDMAHAVLYRCLQVFRFNAALMPHTCRNTALMPR